MVGTCKLRREGRLGLSFCGSYQGRDSSSTLAHPMCEMQMNKGAPRLPYKGIGPRCRRKENVQNLQLNAEAGVDLLQCRREEKASRRGAIFPSGSYSKAIEKGDEPKALFWPQPVQTL